MPYPRISKYKLYELSVQSPNWQVDYLPQFHAWLTGKTPYSFREDFCGSGKIACEWVKRSKKHTALGLDIDPEALRYANEINRSELDAHQKRRLNFIKQDVLKKTKQKFDMIGAFNFSFFVFHERKKLLQYFKSTYDSLHSKGTLFLEVAGGPGFIENDTESKTFTVKGLGKVKQTWEQHQYDPITQINDYSIHFKLPDGSILNDAFQYHWRIWQIREIREALADAGFKKSVVLWEQNGEFLPAESSEPFDSFIAYVVALKK